MMHGQENIKLLLWLVRWCGCIFY